MCVQSTIHTGISRYFKDKYDYVILDQMICSSSVKPVQHSDLQKCKDDDELSRVSIRFWLLDIAKSSRLGDADTCVRISVCFVLTTTRVVHLRRLNRVVPYKQTNPRS